MYIFAKIRENGEGQRAGDGGQGEGSSTRISEDGSSDFSCPAPGNCLPPHPMFWSCNHFIRPEESFITLGPSHSQISFGTSTSQEWVQAVLPPQSTVYLCHSPSSKNKNSEGDGGSPDLVDPGPRDPAPRTERNSSGASASTTGLGVSPESTAARKFMRYTCRTCAEKLPTLNSLKTHLKSHSRAHTGHHNGRTSFGFLTERMPSQVVTSKYGRRRSVISALLVVSPGALRR